jgi:hypothetical protein
MVLLMGEHCSEFIVVKIIERTTGYINARMYEASAKNIRNAAFKLPNNAEQAHCCSKTLETR